MVKLYTWYPTTPAVQMHHLWPPNFGHSALEVDQERVDRKTYISYWPEADSLVGMVSHFFQPPPSRFPPTYADEIDPNGVWLRREAERIDHLHGLDEELMADNWDRLQESHYDVRHWNCSNVTQFLILSSMDSRYFECMKAASRMTVDDMNEISGVLDMRGVVRYLATESFVDSIPDSTVRLAEAYRMCGVDGSADIESDDFQET